MLYSSHTWDLVQALESASPASCKPPRATQNPGLREVDFKPSPKKGSDKINRLRPRGKNTTDFINKYSLH